MGSRRINDGQEIQREKAPYDPGEVEPAARLEPRAPRHHHDCKREASSSVSQYHDRETHRQRRAAMSPTMQHVRGVRYKTLDASIQDVTGRLIEFIASQEVPDRDGDVIEVAGIDTTDFMRNPILLGDHDKSF